jgi:hypothetical protein
MIYQKNYETHRIHDAIRIFTRIQRVIVSYILNILYEYYKDRDLRSSFLKVPNCSMDLVL